MINQNRRVIRSPVTRQSIPVILDPSSIEPTEDQHRPFDVLFERSGNTTIRATHGACCRLAAIFPRQGAGPDLSSSLLRNVANRWEGSACFDESIGVDVVFPQTDRARR